jgi:hypothetical protein
MQPTRATSLLLVAAITLMGSGCAWLSPAGSRHSAAAPGAAVATARPPLVYTEPPMPGQECHDLSRRRGAMDEAAIRQCMGMLVVERPSPPMQPTPVGSGGSGLEAPLPPRVYRN